MLSSLASVVLAQFTVLTALHALFHFPRFQSALKQKNVFIVACTLILALQLGFAAFQTKEVGDVMLFAGAGWHLRHQIDFYFIDAQHSQYPFFPFLIFLHAGLNALQVAVPLATFSWYLKIALSLCLVGICWVILAETKKTMKGRAAVLQFLSHPITTLVLFFHGQVDVFLLLFVIFAFWLQKKQMNVIPMFASICLFAASIAAKTWSVLLLPYFWLQQSWRWRLLSPLIIIAALIGNVFVYTRLVDGSSVRTVLPAIGAAGGPIGEWGLSIIWSNTTFWSSFGLYIVLAVTAIVTLWLQYKKAQLWDALLVIILAIQIVLPRWGIQYLFWSLPFWYLGTKLNNRQRLTLTITAGGYAVLNYLNIAQQIEQLPILFPELLVQSIGLVCWAVTVYCCLQLIEKLRKERNEL